MDYLSDTITINYLIVIVILIILGLIWSSTPEPEQSTGIHVITNKGAFKVDNTVFEYYCDELKNDIIELCANMHHLGDDDAHAQHSLILLINNSKSELRRFIFANHNVLQNKYNPEKYTLAHEQILREKLILEINARKFSDIKFCNEEESPWHDIHEQLLDLLVDVDIVNSLTRQFPSMDQLNLIPLTNLLFRMYDITKNKYFSLRDLSTLDNQTPNIPSYNYLQEMTGSDEGDRRQYTEYFSKQKNKIHTDKSHVSSGSRFTVNRGSVKQAFANDNGGLINKKRTNVVKMGRAQVSHAVNDEYKDPTIRSIPLYEKYTDKATLYMASEFGTSRNSGQRTSLGYLGMNVV